MLNREGSAPHTANRRRRPVSAARDLEWQQNPEWKARTMSHAVTLVTDDRNRVRAQCRCAWQSPWITPDQHSRPRQTVAERVAGRHLQETAR
jgi:hypothetical protein